MVITKRVIPVGEMVLLRAIRSDVSQGGVVLPESTRANRSLGHLVLEVGDDVTRCEAGDIVIIHGNGAFITMDGIEEDLFLVKEDQILGRLEDIEEEE